MKSSFLAVAAFLLSTAAQAGEPVSRFYTVRVDVDATGTVTAAEPVGDVMQELQASLVAAAHRAEFDPATKGGVPVPSRTAVLVRVDFVPAGNDISAKVSGVSAGAVVPLTPPRYPEGALRRGVSARVMLRVAFDATGRLDPGLTGVESVEGVPRRDGSPAPVPTPYESQFRAAALAALEGWTYTPDEVDGQPVAMDVRIPLTFCSGRDNGCAAWRAPAAAASTVAPADASVRLAAFRSAGAAAADAGS